MSFPTKLVDKLYAAVDAEETETVCKILPKISKLLKHPDHSYVQSCVVDILLLKATNSKNKNFVEQVVRFLKHEAKICPDSYLGQAIMNGDVNTARFFLQNGAGFKKREWLETQASRYVFCKSDSRKEMLKLLVRFGLLIPTRRNKSGDNLLHSFIDQVDKDDSAAVEIAETLVHYEVSVNEVNGKGLSPLILSIKTQNIGLISFLIDSGADVNQKYGQYQLFPLYLAARYDNKELIDLLLSRGADVNERSHKGWTPLHLACHFHNRKNITWLIHKGADTNAKDHSGRIPFSLLKQEIMYLMDV